MKLRVWIPPMAEIRVDSLVEFEVLDNERNIKHRGESTMSALPKDMTCELVLHGRDGILLEIKMPKLARSKLAAALPGLVEERLASDAEAAHVVATERGSDGSAIAAIVDRALLSRTVESFARNGRQITSATLNPLAIGWKPGTWRVRMRHGFGSVRTSETFGVAIASNGDVPIELKLAIAQSSNRPSVVEVDGDCNVPEWSEALGTEVKQVAPETQAPVVPLDLLQYGFAPRVADWKSLRTLVALAATLLVVTLGGLNLHAWKLRAEEKDLRAQMEEIVLGAIPGVPAILDPLAQMQDRVSDLRAGAGIDSGGFIALAAAFAEIAPFDSITNMEFGRSALSVQFEPGTMDSDAKRASLTTQAANSGLSVRFSGERAVVSRRGRT